MADCNVELVGRRVAICEDEAITMMQLSRILPRRGMEVVGCARNGREGVNMVMEERPEIVLMDINMPVMDGMEAMRQILAQFKTCIVMLTAYNDQEMMKEAFDSG